MCAHNVTGLACLPRANIYNRTSAVFGLAYYETALRRFFWLSYYITALRRFYFGATAEK